MATSTTTLLEAVNRVLRDVGERNVNVIANPASLKAKSYLQEAFLDIQTYNDWSWQKDYFTADSWADEVATFAGLKRISACRFFNSSVQTPITEVDPLQFYELAPLQDFEDLGGCPDIFALLSDVEVGFNPYPSDTAGKARVTIYGWRSFDPPETPDSLFSCPETIMPLLIKYATYMMLLRHLGDGQEAQQVLNEFTTKLQYMVAKDKTKTTKSGNMYKRHRTYGRY